MFLSNIKRLFLVSMLSVAATAAYADGPFYNCQSDSTYFFVGVQGNSCYWQVRTGVTTPVGGYQPTVAVMTPNKFEISNPTVEKCSPQAKENYNATIMQFDGLSLTCFYQPNDKGVTAQEVDFDVSSNYVMQVYKNSKWVTVQSQVCPDANTANCRIAPANQK